jgi:predicted dehydrogenase
LSDIKIAIVGCGMIADDHVQEIRKIPEAKIIAVCDREPLMGEMLAERLDIPCHYSDMEDMLTTSRPDIVHIITPPDTHLSLGLTALEAGCHVLMEKPFTVYAHEARQLIEKAKSVERKITVNHFHNLSPAALQLRSIISNGLLGDIIHVESFFGYSLKSPVLSTLLKDQNGWFCRLPGRLLQNNISHLLSKIVELMPDEDPVVSAYASRFGEETKAVDFAYVHDELRVLMAWKNQTAYATFSSNIFPILHFMRVYGTKGTVNVDYVARTIVHDLQPKIPRSVAGVLIPYGYAKQHVIHSISNIIKFARSDFQFYAGMNKLLTLFYDSIRKGGDVPIPYDEIIRLSALMDEIRRQVNAACPAIIASGDE